MSLIKKFKIRIFDLVLTFSLIGFLIIAFMINFWEQSGQNKQLLIETPDGTFYYNLQQKKIMEFKGACGITSIEIKDGQFRFVASCCQNKDCIKMGWVSAVKYPVICLPNKISAYIISPQSTPLYDGISQ